MSISGLIGSDSWQGANEKVNPYLPLMFEKTPMKEWAQLNMLMLKLKKREQWNNNEFGISEIDVRPSVIYADGAILAGDATLNLDDGTANANRKEITRFLRAGSTLELRDTITGASEIVRVTSDPTTDGVVDVTGGRGYASTVAAGVANNAGISILSQVNPEGDCLPKASSATPEETLQYMQTFQTSVTLTDEASKVALQHTKNPWAAEKVKALSYFTQDQENACIYHRLNKVTGANNQPQRMMAGLLQRTTAQASLVTVAGAITEANLMAGLELPYRYGSELVVFGGSGAMVALWKYVKTNTQFRVVDAGSLEYGFRVTRLVHQLGSLLIMPPHPMLTRDPARRFDLFGVNFDYVGAKHLFDQSFLDNQQTPGCLVHSGQWRSTWAPEWRNPDSRFFIKDLQSIT